MKRIFIAAVAILAITVSAEAQQKVCPGQSPLIVMAGDYNSTTLAGGAKTTPLRAEKVWKASLGQNRLYTSLDTIDNTEATRFYSTLNGNYASVYTWLGVTSISGTNTSCTAKLYVSADAVYSVNPVCVYTATVTANTTIAHLINSGEEWPYSSWFWDIQGVGTHSTSVYSGALVR